MTFRGKAVGAKYKSPLMVEFYSRLKMDARKILNTTRFLSCYQRYLSHGDIFCPLVATIIVTLLLGSSEGLSAISLKTCRAH
jgi:hypothetical protein